MREERRQSEGTAKREERESRSKVIRIHEKRRSKERRGKRRGHLLPLWQRVGVGGDCPGLGGGRFLSKHKRESA